MLSKKALTKGPIQQTTKENKSTDYSYEPESDFDFDSQDLESRTETNAGKQNPTGRPGANHFQRPRRAYKSNVNVVLNQIFDVKSLGEMSIFKNLFQGVESWEVFEFLESHKTFIQVLKLQMEDRSLNFDIQTFKRHDFKAEFLYEPVPRTFICGLIRLKEYRGVEKGQASFEVTEAEIKALYMSCLLLISVGEIPKKEKSQKPEESSEEYFHRIVTFLLDESGFLTPKLYYYITANWGNIIQMVLNQFDQDNSKIQKGNKKLNQDFSCLNIQERSKSQMKGSLKTNDEYPLQQNFDYNEFIQEQESIEVEKSKRKRVIDVEQKFMTESKPKNQNQGKNQTQVNPQNQSKSWKRSEPCTFQIGAIEGQKRQKLNYLDPAVQKARKIYNFGQHFTRDRSGKEIKKGKKKVLKVKLQKHKVETTKEDLMVEQENEKNSIKMTGIPEFSCLDEGYENIFENDPINYNFRRKDSISSIDYLFSESFGSISNEEENRSSQEEVIPNQRDDTQEQNVMEIEEVNESATNPNRKVKHEKRQIDHMIKALIEDRFVMIQSIANQIYHSLKAVNATVVKEGRRHYSRNLEREFSLL